MPKVLVFAIALTVLVTGATVLLVGIDRAVEVTNYDQSLYLTVLALIYIAGDALRRALR